MQGEQVQQQGQPEQKSCESEGTQETHQGMNDALIQQLAAQQAMLQQLAADQQAMWQHMQAWQAQQPPQGQPGGQPHGHPQGQAGAQPQGHPGGDSCNHHVNPAQQTEHFMRMADKMRRGDVNMEDIAGSMSFLNTQSGSFWKGLLIGGGLTLVLGNASIRESLMGLFSKDEDKSK